MSNHLSDSVNDEESASSPEAVLWSDESSPQDTPMDVWEAVASENTLDDDALAEATRSAFEQDDPPSTDSPNEDWSGAGGDEPKSPEVTEPKVEAPTPVAERPVERSIPEPAAEADSALVYAAVTKAQRSLAVIGTHNLYPNHADEVSAIVDSGRKLLADLRNLIPED